MMLKIDNELLDELTAKAEVSPRLRANYDLRTSTADQSQRMLNALEPGTQVPIHRHTKSTETVVVLRGSVRQNLYDDNGAKVDSFIITAGGSPLGFSMPVGQWHNSESLEHGTVIMETKDGAYEPLKEEDTMQ